MDKQTSDNVFSDYQLLNVAFLHNQEPDTETMDTQDKERGTEDKHKFT